MSFLPWRFHFQTNIQNFLNQQTSFFSCADHFIPAWLFHKLHNPDITMWTNKNKSFTLVAFPYRIQKSNHGRFISCSFISLRDYCCCYWNVHSQFVFHCYIKTKNHEEFERKQKEKTFRLTSWFWTVVSPCCWWSSLCQQVSVESRQGN